MNVNCWRRLQWTVDNGHVSSPNQQQLVAFFRYRQHYRPYTLTYPRLALPSTILDTRFSYITDDPPPLLKVLRCSQYISSNASPVHDLMLSIQPSCPWPSSCSCSWRDILENFFVWRIQKSELTIPFDVLGRTCFGYLQSGDKNIITRFNTLTSIISSRES